MNDRVELTWKARKEVMAPSFRLREIEDADRPLQARLTKTFPEHVVVAQDKETIANVRLMKQPLIALRHGRNDRFAFGVSVPARRRSDGT